MHEFIKQLKIARMELSTSMRQLEKDTGLTRSHMSKIEKGESNVSIKSGILLCDYYGIDINLFIDYKKDMTLLEMKRVSEELEIRLQYNM